MKAPLPLAVLLALFSLPLMPTVAAADDEGTPEACELVAAVVITDNDKGPVVTAISTPYGCRYEGLFVRVACTPDPLDRMCMYAGPGVS